MRKKGEQGALLSFAFGAAPLDPEKAAFESESSEALRLRMPKCAFQGIIRRFSETCFLHNQRAAYKQQGMVTISGAQFSQEEKYISRSRDCSQCPPLVALKDSFMFFYQTQDTLFHLVQARNLPQDSEIVCPKIRR